MQPYGPPPAKSKTSAWQKTLLGCVIGCGALILLSLIGGGIGAWWMVKPGKQEATAAVVSPQSTGAFIVSDLAADPGVTALFDRFMREAQRQQQRDLPPWIRQMQQMGAAGSPSAGLRMFLPRQATISLEPSTEGRDEPAVVAAVNPRGMTNLLHFVLARGNTLQGQHRGHDLLRLNDRAWASLVGGTLLVANEEEALRHGIDRVLDGTPTSAPPPPDLGAPVRQWDFTGTADGSEGKLAEILWGDEPAPPGVRRALLGIDVATSDVTNGRVIVDCTSPEAASEAALALDRHVAERSQELADKGLALRATSRVDGTRAVLDWDVSGVNNAITAWMTKTREQRYEPAPEPVDEPTPGEYDTPVVKGKGTKAG
ncbi:MAG TPA: hypothetical protein VGS57_22825 [Thermoanaerobaculia bacterium]|jgi:hypothetical protein|nr:hypothetical protein [Thermoanaerobaculia bacterium]